MTHPPATHYLNADFDLSLRPRPRQAAHAVLERQVRELSALALLGADAGDSALVRVGIPEAFLDYLAARGVPVPRVRTHPGSDPATQLRPFGWNAEAIALNRRHARPAAHPTLECVRAVNARSFAFALERELFPETAAGALVKDTGELEAFLARAAPAGEWILKSEHGNAGLANRRLRRPALTDADRRFVRERLAEDDRLLIEPFRARLADWSMVFDVPFDAATLRFHDTDCTRDGGLIGALYDSGTTAAFARDRRLTDTAERVAGRLAEAGYFGPVCADGFSFGEPASPDVRPLVDLNCRRTVSEGVFRLWRFLAPERSLYFRFFTRDRLRLPPRVTDAEALLGDAAYSPATRTGILLGSPTQFAGDAGEGRPLKQAVLFFGRDRAEARALAERFRERHEARR